MTQTSTAQRIDTRAMDHKQRRAQVFSAFDQLGVNETVDVVSDHDPVTLRSQFELEKAKRFAWAYLESGPEVWNVAITKLKGQHGADHCCGACGG